MIKSAQGDGERTNGNRELSRNEPCAANDVIPPTQDRITVRSGSRSVTQGRSVTKKKTSDRRNRTRKIIGKCQKKKKPTLLIVFSSLEPRRNAQTGIKGKGGKEANNRL